MFNFVKNPLSKVSEVRRRVLYFALVYQQLTGMSPYVKCSLNTHIIWDICLLKKFSMQSEVERFTTR